MIQIRQATLADAADIVRLIQEMDSDGGNRSPLTEAFVAGYLSSPVSAVLLAVMDGRPADLRQPIGLLAYSIRPDLFHAASSCYVEELVVARSQRSQGVGGALLDEVLRRASKAGCAEVSLSVMPDNEQAIRLYRQHGLVDEALFLEKHFK